MLLNVSEPEALLIEVFPAKVMAPEAVLLALVLANAPAELTPVPTKLKALLILIPPERAKVPPLLTVTAELPKAVELATVRIAPLLIEVVPVKLLAVGNVIVDATVRATAVPLEAIRETVPAETLEFRVIVFAVKFNVELDPPEIAELGFTIIWPLLLLVVRFRVAPVVQVIGVCTVIVSVPAPELVVVTVIIDVPAFRALVSVVTYKLDLVPEEE